MFRLLKWLLGFVITLVTLILLAVIIVPMVFDPNDYRNDITALVKQQIGRDLILDGELDISVFPWLGIRTSGLRLSQPIEIGGDMIRVNTAQLRVKFAPLLRRKVHVDTVVLEKPEIRLVTLSNGLDSFYGLTNEQAAVETKETQNSQPGTSPDAGVAIVLQGLEVTDGRVLIDDRSQQSITELAAVNLATGNLLGNDFATLDANGSLISSNGSAPVLFDLKGLANINTETLLVQFKDLTATVTSGSEKANIELATIRFSEQSTVELKGLTASLHGSFKANVTLPSLVADLDSQRADIPLIELNSGELVVNMSDLVASNFIDAPSVSGNVVIPAFNAKTLLQEFEVDYQAANPNSLQSVSLEASLLANLERAEIKDLSIRLDKSSLQGVAGVVNFDQPEVTFDLVLDELNLDDYLPVNNQEEAVSEPTAGGADALSVPMEVFRELQANGQFKAKKFVSGGVELTNIDVQVSSSPGKVTIKPTASLYEGSIGGQIAFSDDNGMSSLSVTNQVDLVQLGELLNAAQVTDQLSGLGSILIDLVFTEKEGVQTNRGIIKLQAKDGAIRGVDVKEIVDSAYTQYRSLRGEEPTQEAEGDSDVSDETRFAEVFGTFNINNNVISNDDFSLKAPLFRVAGGGIIDVAKQSLDYLVELKLVSSTDGQGGKSIDDLAGIPIPIRLSGDLTAPSYSIDLKQLYRSLVKRELDRKKGEFLQQKLGIEDGENRSTKTVLRDLLSDRLDKKLKKDQPAQERPLTERGENSEADDSSGESTKPSQEQSKSAEDQLKEDLKNKLLDGLFGS